MKVCRNLYKYINKLIIIKDILKINFDFYLN